jgi:Transcriptional regulators of sugar metabolism
LRVTGESDSVARYQRWNALLDLLPGDGELTVAQAARALGVSEATDPP